MNNTPLSPRNDIVFKAIFGETANIPILAHFLQAVLDLPEEEYEEIALVDPHLLRETKSDKQGILDLRITTKNKSQINVELQVAPQLTIWKRMQFYNARLLTNQIKVGESYAKINRAISVLISYPILLEKDKEPHHCFKMYDEKNKTTYPDSSEIHVLEVRKAGVSKEVTGAKDTALLNWLKFFAAETEEEFEMSAQNTPAIAKAWGVIQRLSGDERTRMIAELEEKVRRDEEDRLLYARSKGLQEGELKGKLEGKLEEKQIVARKLLTANVPVAVIADATGLTPDEIKHLSQETVH